MTTSTLLDVQRPPTFLKPGERWYAVYTLPFRTACSTAIAQPKFLHIPAETLQDGAAREDISHYRRTFLPSLPLCRPQYRSATVAPRQRDDRGSIAGHARRSAAACAARCC